MTIEQIEVSVRDVVDGYVNNDEQGVRGYGGRLDIRPPYQREFIYNEREQEAVITTVLNGYPLNVMYWVRRSDDADCPYEVMDGQQRTLSLCQYVNGTFAYDYKYFQNQPADVQRRILDYRLTVYVCEGEPSEKLAWFKTINIAGKPLNEQEIRNAVYAGPFTSDAKRHFSKTNCGAWNLAKDLVVGSPIRQEFLKKALEWMADHETRSGHRQTLEGYMAAHQHDPNALNLWTYFQTVCNWATDHFSPQRFRKAARRRNPRATGHHPVRARRRRTPPRPACLLRGHPPRRLRGAGRPVRPLRQGDGRNVHGGRPHRAVEQGRPHGQRELPDALPRLQPAQVRPLTRLLAPPDRLTLRTNVSPCRTNGRHIGRPTRLTFPLNANEKHTAPSYPSNSLNVGAPFMTPGTGAERQTPTGHDGTHASGTDPRTGRAGRTRSATTHARGRHECRPYANGGSHMHG